MKSRPALKRTTKQTRSFWKNCKELTQKQFPQTLPTFWNWTNCFQKSKTSSSFQSCNKRWEKPVSKSKTVVKLLIKATKSFSQNFRFPSMKTTCPKSRKDSISFSSNSKSKPTLRTSVCWQTRSQVFFFLLKDIDDVNNALKEIN
jgi:hypothetical protein